MLVHRRVTRMAAALSSPYPVIQLGGERHCESKVSCPKTQHNVPSQVTFLLKFNLLVSFFPFFSYGTIRDRAREVIPYSCGASFIREEIWKQRFYSENTTLKTRSGKPRDYRDVIAFEKLYFQNVFRPHEDELLAFSNAPCPVWRTYSKGSVVVTD